MDLEFSDEQAALRDNVRSVIARVCPPSVARGMFEGQPAPPAIWNTMVDLDWPGLAIAEDLGGLGSTFVELAIVAEELGRATVPSLRARLRSLSERGALDHMRELLCKRRRRCEQMTPCRPLCAGRSGLPRDQHPIAGSECRPSLIRAMPAESTGVGTGNHGPHRPSRSKRLEYGLLSSVHALDQWATALPRNRLARFQP